MEAYFVSLNKEIQRSYELASLARSKGYDPEEVVEIPIAQNMAERVVGLVSVVAPQTFNVGIDKRIIELEKEFGLLDWRVGLKIAEEVAIEKFCKFETKLEAIETGIRIGFAYLTLGIVSAPLEGFIGIKIKQRKDGKEYFALQYAGPIRAAGGTAASTSVILADYVRIKLGYAPYDPQEAEINRYFAEVEDYHERVSNLQYHPSEEELKFLVGHLPVEVDGDPTEKTEVSNYKDQPRIETNFIRGGVALVLAEGLCQKAPKLWKNVSKWGKNFDLEWDWLSDFLKLKEKIHSAHNVKEGSNTAPEVKTVKANDTFIMDLVAGRPILTHPLAVGGFRLRYGRSRTTGIYSVGVHPATLIVLHKYIAIGTQLKVERPRKAASVTVCDTLEGPIVRLNDGSVLQLDKEDEAKRVFSSIEEIIFLGDLMFNYGDFAESGHSLVPVGYCSEWWCQELEKAILSSSDKDQYFSASEKTNITPECLQEWVNDPFVTPPSAEEAIAISIKLKIPLHPKHTFYWKLIDGNQLTYFFQWLKEGKIKTNLSNQISKIILPLFSEKNHQEGKRTLDELGISHAVINKESVVIEQEEAQALAASLGIKDQKSLLAISFDHSLFINKTGLDYVNSVAPFPIRDKAGTFIGARMGRPEKSKMRLMTGSPQVMFPVGEEGDRLRSFQSTIDAGKIESTFPLFYCSHCNQETIYHLCEKCNHKTTPRYSCRTCGILTSETCRHGKGVPYKRKEIDIKHYFESAMALLGEAIHADLIKGIRGTSNKDHIVEHLAKGILRAKHNIYVNKDGTTRYDCTELPITHFKPKEIKTSVSKLRKLGYLFDIKGLGLENEDQILELLPQDIILPGFDSLEESGPQVLSRVAHFVDDELTKLYKVSSFYNLKKEEDLIGHLVVGLAPHISAGLIGRIIGFSETQGLFAHPMFHAGMRRDCDGDEACVMMLMDALLNFSRRYLPERRGAKTMDAPLVLTTTINPAEVDDQVLEMDVAWKYPLELYEAALELKAPGEVRFGTEKKKIEQLRDRLGTSLQYEKMGFTHSTDNLNKGILCSAYKILPSMEEKLFGQMEIANKVRAVDMDDVAKLVIQKHFLRDIKGNLKKFSMQQFRCLKCNEKYRRPPLTSQCVACGGKLGFTITEGSVVKYLYPSLKLAEKYDFSPYLKQTLNILKTNVDVLFGKEKEKQVGLGTFLEQPST